MEQHSTAGNTGDLDEGIHLLITGGTIDGIYSRSENIENPQDSSVAKYIRDAVVPHFEIFETPISMKDSRQITDSDREKMLQVISSSKFRRFLITHGTFTMPQTAEYLLKNINQLANKTIVLTGSFFPLANMVNSDAPFNLGFAIAALKMCSPGIYVAMNGHCFPAGGVAYEDVQRGLFIPKRK